MRAILHPRAPLGRGLCVFAMLTGLLTHASAGDLASSAATPGGVWQAVGDRTLAQLRGGFDADGLRVSVGITRAVYVNGELATQMTLNLGSLSELNPAQAAEVGRQLASMRLVQIGPGNSVQPGAADAAGSMVIQNSLDNQQILHQTTIHASSNALGMVKQLQLQRTIDDAISQACCRRP